MHQWKGDLKTELKSLVLLAGILEVRLDARPDFFYYQCAHFFQLLLSLIQSVSHWLRCTLRTCMCGAVCPDIHHVRFEILLVHGR